jgi:hypothetical protein
MLHTVEPGPFFDATSVMDCPSKVNVRSNARGWNTAVLPSAKVRWAAFQVVAAWASPLLTTKVPAPTDPQSNVPVRADLAFTGEADAPEAARPTIPAERAVVAAMPAANRWTRRLGLLISYLPAFMVNLPFPVPPRPGIAAVKHVERIRAPSSQTCSRFGSRGRAPQEAKHQGRGVQREAT